MTIQCTFEVEPLLKHIPKDICESPCAQTFKDKKNRFYSQMLNLQVLKGNRASSYRCHKQYSMDNVVMRESVHK